MWKLNNDYNDSPQDQELKKMQQKMAESEAKWMKIINENKAAMAEVTAEREYLRREVEQLKTQVHA